MSQIKDDIEMILGKEKTKILFNNVALNENTIPLMDPKQFIKRHFSGISLLAKTKVWEYLIKEHRLGQNAGDSKLGYIKLLGDIFGRVTTRKAISWSLYYPSKIPTYHRNVIREILWTLESKECLVIRERFGIGVNRTKTLYEVGRMLNIGQARVLSVEQKALRKLRHPTRSKLLEETFQELIG